MRLQHLRPAELDDEQRTLYEVLTDRSRVQVPFHREDVRMADADGRLQGPFNALLYHPRLGLALQEVSRRLRFEGVLSTRTRELVILVVAASERSDFEWVAHAAIASTLGIADEQVEALATGKAVRFDDPKEDAAVTLARALVDAGDADDETYDRARAALGDAAIVELTTTIGVYQLLALQMRLFRVPAPRGPWW